VGGGLKTTPLGNKLKGVIMDTKNILTFFYPIIDSLSKGSLIRKVMSFLFGLLGVLSFIGGIYLFFKSISYAPDFWSVVFLLLLLISSFFTFQIWFYRANVVLNLSDSDFTVIPIFAQLFRAVGETYATFIISIGLGGTLTLWFSNYLGNLWEFANYIPFLSNITNSFFGGILFFLLTIISAFFILLITYFLAENILVLVEIAKNTRSQKKENEL